MDPQRLYVKLLNKFWKNMEITAHWIVGFVDGDGHFGFGKTHVGSERFYFVVSQHERSKDVLYALKTFFQCGTVQKSGKEMTEYKVTSRKHLETIIIPFFQKYPLKTIKNQQFQSFARKLLNLPLSKNEEQGYDPAPGNRLEEEWLLGFLDAEACFTCSLIQKTFRPQMILGLSGKDAKVLDNIQKLLNCGIRYTRKNGVEVFQLSSNRDMVFLVKNFLLTRGFKDRLRTQKRIRARKWSQIVLLMSEKKHKTVVGFEKMKGIQKTLCLVEDRVRSSSKDLE